MQQSRTGQNQYSEDLQSSDREEIRVEENEAMRRDMEDGYREFEHSMKKVKY